MSTTVSIATVTLQAFEVPSAINFGSLQRMAVHDMPGGGRVIDVLGGSSSEIIFGGILSGGDAEERAYLLDALCISGVTVPLVWGQQWLMVIIAQANFDYQKSWWIPYRLRCVISSDLLNSVVSTTVSVASTILSNLAIANTLLNPISSSIEYAQTAIMQPDATLPGTGAFTTSLNTLSAAQSNLASSVTNSGASLPAFDLSLSNKIPATAALGVTSMTSSAESLASAVAASSYVGSSLNTLSSLGA